MGRYILLILATFIAPFIQAQSLNINGSIAIEESGAEGAKVIIFKNSEKLDEQVIGKKGRFELKLAFDNDYKISFEKAGYITKIVSVNTEVPPEILETSPDFPPVRLIINLLPHAEGVDLSIFEQPVAILSYNNELDDFTFDKDYSSRIKDPIAKTEQEVRRVLAQRGSAALEKERMFADLVTKGQNGFDQKKWPVAIENWTQALTIKPAERTVQQKLDIAKKENELELARLSVEAQNARGYKLLVSSGDSLFNLKIYGSAKEKYAAAIKLNSKDGYPAQRISEIDGLLAQLAKEEQQNKEKQALADNYKRLIAVADQLYGQKNYDGAEPKYREALALNYEKVYPEQQLKAIAAYRQQEADRLKQDAAIADNYQKIITAADNSFNTKAYEEAIRYYNQASGVKPAEVYPKEMIAKAEQAMTQLKQQLAADAEKKRQEELKRAELMNSYQQVIAEADRAFEAENYMLARSRYTDADNLNTGEAHPKNKLKEINTIFNSAKYQQRLTEFNKNKEAGEKALQTKNYASAKFYYQKAVEILPSEGENLRERMSEIDRLIQEEQLAAINKEYNAHILKADEAFKEKSYAVAKVYYLKALAVKKNDSYATEQLKEVETYISERTEKTVEL